MWQSPRHRAGFALLSAPSLPRGRCRWRACGSPSEGDLKSETAATGRSRLGRAGYPVAVSPSARDNPQDEHL